MRNSLCLLTFLFLTVCTSLIQAESNISISFNGTFVHQATTGDAKANSPNGLYWCDYTVGRVGCAERDLLDFRFFENDRLLFEMDRAPASDLYISNSGVIAFMDLTYHFKQEVTVHFYSREGQHLFSKTFKGAHGYSFSADGDKFGAMAGDQTHVIKIPTGETEIYPGDHEFDFSEDGRTVAIAKEESICVYSNGNLLNLIATGFLLPRRVGISSDHNLLAVIDKRNLNVYSLADGTLIFTDRLTGVYSYRDLSLADGEVQVGIHYRHNGVSKGILRIYNTDGTIISEIESESNMFQTFHEVKPLERSSANNDSIPWPFIPFDEMHTIWNYYEQHMGGGEDWSYLHQGLDMIVPIGEPTYAVAPGIVKCVLTISGDYHWRIAISPEQDPGWSDGWLYAHLIESTIQFDVGDTVQLHDYLGDIIEWTIHWGHIHFVEIADSGLVWSYDDNEWGINFNPLLVLEPDTDSIPPVIENVFTDSKFGFCENESSNYLDPDSLYGDIDIITKVVDYIGDSQWQQPAFSSYYWVENLPEGDIVFPRTLGHVLNHKYSFYSSGYYEPYATVLYKRDAVLPSPPWGQMERDFYHIMTNNNGDSLIELSEKELAFHTGDYPSGKYRIFIEVFDEYGNSCIDSMDVQFVPSVGIDDQRQKTPVAFYVSQNYPNPFNPSTTISFDIPGTFNTKEKVNVTVYDIRGRCVRTLIDSDFEPGSHKIHWNGRNDQGEAVSSGIYLYQLRAGGETLTRKMTVLK